MMTRTRILILALLVSLGGLTGTASGQAVKRTLDIYLVDTEGGKATLFVTPSGQTVLIEGSYLRKKGQEGLSRDTQQVNKGYYQSETRMELVNPPYLPFEAP